MLVDGEVVGKGEVLIDGEVVGKGEVLIDGEVVGKGEVLIDGGIAGNKGGDGVAVEVDGKRRDGLVVVSDE